jgi:hypothetical protein
MLGKIASLREQVSSQVKDLAKDALSEAKDALREVCLDSILLKKYRSYSCMIRN